jgi:hypothetical protein
MPRPLPSDRALIKHQNALDPELYRYGRERFERDELRAPRGTAACHARKK